MQVSVCSPAWSQIFFDSAGQDSASPTGAAASVAAVVPALSPALSPALLALLGGPSQASSIKAPIKGTASVNVWSFIAARCVSPAAVSRQPAKAPELPQVLLGGPPGTPFA